MSDSRQLLNSGEFEKAIEKFNEEIATIEKACNEIQCTNRAELVVNLSKAYMDRARAFIGMENYDKGLNDLTQAVLFDSNNGEAFLMRGLMNFEKYGNSQKALDDYSKGIELDPTNVVAFVNRSKIYLELKEFDKVLVDCSLAIDLLKLEGEIGSIVDIELDDKLTFDPNDMFIKAHMNRVVALMGKGEFEKAFEDLTQLTKRISKERYPKELSNIYVYRGALNEQLSETQKALDDYNSAIKVDPTNAEAWSSRAFIYIEKEEFGKAVNDFTKLIEIDPLNEVSYRKRGNVYMVMEKFEEALKDINKSIELVASSENPASSMEESLKVRASIYQSIGEYSKAIEDFQKVIELEPSNYDVLISLGNLYLNEENINQALEYYEKAFELQQSDELSNLIAKLKSGDIHTNQEESGSTCIIN